MEGLVHVMRREKMEEERERCHLGEVSKAAEKIISGTHQNLSMEAINKQEITEETFERDPATNVSRDHCHGTKR